MKRVIDLSKAWIAALVFGIVLTGCGGGSDSQGADPQSVDRSATLSWNAPGHRQNGESMHLYELANYVISYGQDPENLDQTIYVMDDENLATHEYTVENLSDGEWYFCVQAEDQNGLVSAPSEVVSKTIKS